MNVDYGCICIILTAAFLAASGCKDRDTTTASDSGEATVSQAEIDAARRAAPRGMEKVTFDDLQRTRVGKICVVTTGTIEDAAQLGPPPPPRGMVYLLGQTTI